MENQPNNTNTPQEQANNRQENGQFKPGVSGNPGGRPVGSFSIVTILKQRMEEIPIGQVKTWKEQVADKIIERAIVHGDANMLKLLTAYMDGAPKQTVAIDADKESIDSLTALLREAATVKKPDANTKEVQNT